MTDSHDNDLVVDLFNRALALPEAEQRTFVEAQCRDKPALKDEVLFLLQHHRALPPDFLEQSPVVTPEYSRIGESIGPYAITEKIGSGGMAEVYLARRNDGVYKGDVAVKIIRSSRDNHSIVQRFYRERNILASLTHPNIAKLLDGGSTDDGAPFYAMEYIQGATITDYCQDQGLNLQQRLQLFIAVCKAVDFAHQHLVIHRDLKPSNILVNTHGEPKLLDFGIATLLSPAPELDALAPTTLIGPTPLTPHYASPEQIRGEVLTTSSDVYSLGVILYETLTGKSPYNASTQIELIKEVEHKTTPLMSRDSLCHNQFAPSALAGDLDTIVRKTMHKESDGRYHSVRDLSEDIERYLNHRPVQARPLSPWYLTSRFVYRHKIAAVSVALSLGIALIIGVTQQVRVLNERDIAQQQRLAAERERDLARVERDRLEQTQHFITSLFEISNPSESRGNSITAREVLDRGVKIIHDEVQEPAVKSEILTTMGIVYRQLGLYDDAQPLLEEALALRQQTPNTPTSELAANFMENGVLQDALGEYEAAKALYVKALNQLQMADSQNIALSARIYRQLGTAHWRLGDYEQAIHYTEKSVDALKQYPGSDEVETAKALNNLGILHWSLGELETAIDYYQRTLTAFVDSVGENHPNVAAVLNNLCIVYRDTQQYSLGIRHCHRALDIYAVILEPNHPDIAGTLINLGVHQRMLGRYQEAINTYQKALTLLQSANLDRHPTMGELYNNLGLVYGDLGEIDQEIKYHEKAQSVFLETLGEDHIVVANSYNNIGQLLERQGELDQAIDYFEKTLRIYREVLEPQHSDFAYPYDNLGTIYYKKGDYEKAANYSRLAIDIRKDSMADDNLLLANPYHNLGNIEVAKGNYSQAKQHYQRALDIASNHPKQDQQLINDLKDKIEQLGNLKPLGHLRKQQ